MSHVDHVGLTVPDLNAAALILLTDVIGGHELYPLPARTTVRRSGKCRAWLTAATGPEAHINVARARLTIAMISIGPNLMLELFQYDRPADRNEQPPLQIATSAGTTFAFKVENLETRESLSSRMPWLQGYGWTHRPRQPGPVRHDPRQLRARSLWQPARTGRIHDAGLRSVGAGRKIFPALTSGNRESSDAEHRHHRFGSSRSSRGSWPHQRRIPRDALFRPDRGALAQ